MRHLSHRLLIFVFSLLLSMGGVQAQYHYITLDYPNSISNHANGISGNNIVGWYFDRSNNGHSFLYNGSTYTTIDDPNAVNGTYAWGISGNKIVGFYYAPVTFTHDFTYGFLYDGNHYINIDYLNAPVTIPFGISGNNIVGDYEDSSGTFHGFLYNGNTYITIHAPNEGEFGTHPTGISGNNIVGSYIDRSVNRHGFLYNGSTYTTLDDPNAVNGTVAWGISGNNIVGSYSDRSGTHGFLYNGKTYTTLDVPGASNTYAYGISGNNIVGSYSDRFGNTHGFLALAGSLPWGQDVQITFNANANTTNPVTLTGFVVYYDGTNITLSRDISVDSTGKVTVTKTYPINQIQSIVQTNDPFNFNKYIVNVNGDIRTYKLLGYSNGVWSLEKHSINGHTRVKTPVSVADTDLNSLVAIYRTGAPSPAPTPSDVRDILNSAATANNIPPHVLYGLAYEESGSTHRWQQFGINDLGITDNKTCVTWDGGIGLMQLTQAAATVDTLPADGDLLSHIYRLGSDTAYNINAGATKLTNLKAKDEVSPRKRPAIGSGDRRVLESWYYALWGYNGWSSQNDPNKSSSVYQQRVFNWISQAPAGYWTWGNAKLGVPDKHDIGKSPGWMTTSYIPAPWHFDANYSGNIMEYAPGLTITQATVKKSGSTLIVSLTLSNSGTAIAPNVRLTSVTLGGKATITSLLGQGRHTIAQQGTWVVALKFAVAGLSSGQSVPLQVGGAFTGTDASNGAPFTASSTVAIP